LLQLALIGPPNVTHPMAMHVLMAGPVPKFCAVQVERTPSLFNPGFIELSLSPKHPLPVFTAYKPIPSCVRPTQLVAE